MSILNKIEDALPSEYKKDDFSYDLESWKNDGGFWSRLLERDDKICIKTLLNKHLVAVHTWEKVDRIRFIYVCVIAGLVMARDEKKDIPTLYIKLVMDLEKLRAYPWGLHSYDYLVKSITKVKTDLKKEVSYLLNGFSLALQIWAMEAIPSIQFLFGHKLNKELGAVPRCSNWKGLARVSYYQIILIENSMTAKDIVYPYISITGNYDVHESADFMRLGEKKDESIKNLNNLIRSGFDFAEFEWEDIEIDAVEEKKIEEENIEEEKIDQPLDEDKYVEGQTDTHSDDKEAADVIDGGNIVTSLQTRHKEQPTCSKKRKKEADRGAESQKMRLLCQRAATMTGFVEGMKSFIKEMFETSFMQFGQEINKRLEKVHDDVSSLKDDVSSLKETVTAMAETSTKEKARSFKSKAVDENCMFDEYITQTGDIDLNCNLTTQDFLQREMGHLSQKTQVPDFDQSQGLFREDVVPRQRHNYSSEFLDWRCKGDSGKNDVDAVLVYLSEAKWDAFTEWQMNLSREDPKLGPSLLTNALFDRVINPKNWLGNHEIDAMLFLHREKTSIGRLQLDRVGFMNCMFSTRIKTEYERYLKNKKSHKWDSRLLSYVYGENPSHGMTCKRWAMDVDRIYAPVNINNSHWISICINFALRTIEVFDCNAGHNRRVTAEYMR
ncbi:hypothetical protein ARALYDRAFT_917032 [Arabidopsis lyrata subsp. lyrata]|uniref:Ubiquitin-like protease family profile domain-containing protein n=1 Tax=Arabidopsis lyrata subsp. lyrata TaxID=81972 RepID=D7MKW9_ARALL|nr:hypothetical protein ARALYDRAFT_917032 [Arabidopsis lyrata subsp. lyrata]